MLLHAYKNMIHNLRRLFSHTIANVFLELEETMSDET